MSIEALMLRVISKLSFFLCGIWKEISVASNTTVFGSSSTDPRLGVRPFLTAPCSIFLFFDEGSWLACESPVGAVPYRRYSACLAMSSKSVVYSGVESTLCELANKHKIGVVVERADGVEYALLQSVIVPECDFNEFLICFALHFFNTIVGWWAYGSTNTLSHRSKY